MDPSPQPMSSMPLESDLDGPSPPPLFGFPALAEILATRTPLDLRDEPFTPPIPLPPSSHIVGLEEAEPEHDDDPSFVITASAEASFSPEEALAAAQEGIHYATEKYPSENCSISPTFKKEPVALEKGERLHVLDEVQLSPYLSGMRIRVERTGVVGLVPIWVVEGALERLARVNMAFNEAATCPAEMTADNKGPENNNGPTLAHRHSRCVTTTKTKVTKGPPQDDQDDTPDDPSDDELLTPRGANAADNALFPELRRPKSVMFEAVQQRKIFRYPPPPELFVPVKRAAWEDSDDDDTDDDDDSDENVTQERTIKQDKKQKTEPEQSLGNEEENEEWWWDGWEEVPEKSFAEPEARGGRPQVRRRSRWFSEDSSDDED